MSYLKLVSDNSADPVTNLKMMASQLRDYSKPIPAEMRGNLAHIIESCIELYNLKSQLPAEWLQQNGQ